MVQMGKEHTLSFSEQLNLQTPDRSIAPWIDISIPISNTMVHWPNDPPINIKQSKSLEDGNTTNLSQISMGVHSGTHIDAPLHFIEHGEAVDRMPLSTMIGRARVIDIQDTESIKPKELIPHRIRRGQRILFKTVNSSNVWHANSFVDNFVFISDEAADFLAKRGVSVVGVDYLSVGSFKYGGSYVHKTLLGNGVWIIEGLDLSPVGSGTYDLVCLPLKIYQGDGSPARAILRRIHTTRKGKK
jgi:arylformamidase